MKRSFFCLILAVSLSSVCPSQGYAVKTAAPSAPAWSVPYRYLLAYNFLFTLAMTTYRTTLEANKASVDYRDWKMDSTTISNIIGRVCLYFPINNWQSSVNVQKAEKGTDWGKEQDYKISLVKTSISMLTYNSRYDETIVKRQAEIEKNLQPFIGEFVSLYGSWVVLALNNVGWFFVVPMLYSPQVNSAWTTRIKPQSYGAAVFGATKSVVAATSVFTITELVSQHLLDSIKLTIGGVLPAPADLRFLRFPDCPSCFFGLNPFGKSGLVGAPLFYLRETVISIATRGTSTSTFGEQGRPVGPRD